MPRALQDYSVRDWGRLRPPLHALHAWRVRRATRLFAGRPPRAGVSPDKIWAAIRGRRVLVTIAFNDPEIIDCQVRAVRAFVPDVVHVIADNANDSGKAGEIAAVCAGQDTPWLWLPPNPWGSRSPSRSHGAALNWVWLRLLGPGRPDAFGFLDHDLIPLGQDDPFAGLASQPLAGDKRWAQGRWYLWPGFCFFNRAFLDDVEVDFGQDWTLGLDTGGANWARIYSRLDPNQLAERPIERAAVFADRPLEDAYFERRGVWLHEVGTFGRPELKPAKRLALLSLADTALQQMARPARPRKALSETP
jgi:hypothetical protein